MGKQEQFLEVIDRDEAERRFRAALRLEPLGDESVDVAHALGRVLARDVVADADVPSFDRSNFDGFAVRAADTYGAGEEDPRVLRLLDESIATAVVPTGEVAPGTAMAIATGGMLPRGADSVVMIEDTDVSDRELSVRRAVTPGSGVTFAGTDIAASETVLWRGELLTSRETGVLAAIGKSRVDVYRQPRVGILSTGDEIVAPGEALPLGCVYDSNAQILADAVRELGAVPVPLGIVGDDAEKLREIVAAALVECDVLLLSGGTSKGAGDISYRIVRELARARYRRAWRGVETGQACLSGGPPRQTGGGAARLSDFGDLHFPGVRGAGHSMPGRTGGQSCPGRGRAHGRSRQLGDRAHGVLAGLPGASCRKK